MITVLLAAALDRSVETQVNEQLRVEVEDISTTGYRWELSDYDHAVVELEKTGLAPSQAPGGGGLRVFEFRAVGPGRTVLHFRLARSWEKDSSPPLREGSVDVDVKSGRAATAPRAAP